MAATGSNHTERHLARLRRDFRGDTPGRGGRKFSTWVAAVLLVAALSVVAFPVARGEAETVAVAAASDGSTAPVVPILFPLEDRVTWTDTFGAPRSGGRTHAGNDLMAPKMTPILAVVDGEVDWLNLTGKLSSYNSLPYYNILLHGDDGNDYFYIHLNNDTPGTDDGQGGLQYAYAPGLTNGSRVDCGDVIGYVGDSGNAEDAGSHLHFEIHLGGYVAAGAGQTRTPSAIDPYASLKAAPTLAEWTAAGRPPLGTWTSGSSSTTTTASTTTTTSPTTTTSTTSTTTSTTTTTTPPGSVVPGFSDVRTGDWFYADFAAALSAGVVTEAADGRFRPYSRASRALFTVYLVRTMVPGELNAPSGATGPAGAGYAGDGSVFSDVLPGYWAYDEIQTAARLGLVKGTGDGSAFSPEALVTRAQMATMMYRALSFDIKSAWEDEAGALFLPYDDVPEDHWAQGAVALMHYLGLMRGDTDGHFRPEDDTTRAQAITVMARLLRLLEGGSGS